MHPFVAAFLILCGALPFSAVLAMAAIASFHRLPSSGNRYRTGGDAGDFM